MANVPSLFSHTTNLRSGRPEPHRSWLMISAYMWTFQFGAALFCVMAIYYAVWRDRPDALFSILPIAFSFAAIAFLIRCFLTRRKRAFDIATAQYEHILGTLD